MMCKNVIIVLVLIQLNNVFLAEFKRQMVPVPKKLSSKGSSNLIRECGGGDYLLKMYISFFKSSR